VHSTTRQKLHPSKNSHQSGWWSEIRQDTSVRLRPGKASSRQFWQHWRKKSSCRAGPVPPDPHAFPALLAPGLSSGLLMPGGKGVLVSFLGSYGVFISGGRGWR
jgi:hypothetical protein